MEQDAEKAIKKIQLSHQKLKLQGKKKAGLIKKNQVVADLIRQAAKEEKKEQNSLIQNYSYFLAACLKAINFNPLKDVAIILGSLGLLADKIKGRNASMEIDNAIKKYRELISKGIIPEVDFNEMEEEKAVIPEVDFNETEEEKAVQDSGENVQH